jgi:hypothetical protein
LNIGDARLAIFDGDPKIALKLMQSAKTLLNQAGKDAASMGAGWPPPADQDDAALEALLYPRPKPGVEVHPTPDFEWISRLYPLPVRQASALPAASSRPHLTVTPLLFS